MPPRITQRPLPLFVRAASAASLALFALSLSAQAPATSPAQPSAATPAPVPAASLSAEFSKGVDTKKAKTGDEINAKTTSDAKLPDGTELPKGTRLVGNIVEVTPKSKEQKNSHLVLSLNRAITRDGRELPIRAAMTSVTAPAPLQSSEMSSPAGSGMASSGAGEASGAVPSAAPSAPMPSASMSSEPQQAPPAMLKSAEDRVPVGNLPDVVLSAPTTPESAAVLDAQNQNINLSSGTRFTVNVTPSTAVHGGA